MLGDHPAERPAPTCCPCPPPTTAAVAVSLLGGGLLSRAAIGNMWWLSVDPAIANFQTGAFVWVGVCWWWESRNCVGGDRWMAEKREGIPCQLSLALH